MRYNVALRLLTGKRERAKYFPTKPSGFKTNNKIMLDEKENGGKLVLDVFESARTLWCSVPTVRKLIRAQRLPRIVGIRKILEPVMRDNHINIRDHI